MSVSLTNKLNFDDLELQIASICFCSENRHDGEQAKRIASLIRVYVLGRTPRLEVAMDWGTGAIKFSAALIPSEIRALGLIVKEGISDGAKLARDASKNRGMISASMQTLCLDFLKNKCKTPIETFATSIGCVPHYRGIATDVFRGELLRNGVDLLRRAETELGLPFEVISPTTEGLLGFITTQSLYPEALKSGFIAYDSGGGSFQLCIEGGAVYAASVGQAKIESYLFTTLRRLNAIPKEASGNPILSQEAEQLREWVESSMPPAPVWFTQRLVSESCFVGVLGNHLSTFGLAVHAIQVMKWERDGVRIVKEASFAQIAYRATVDDVRSALHHTLGKPDSYFVEAQLESQATMNLILLSGVMGKLGMRAFYYRPLSSGNGRGMLLSPELLYNASPPSKK